MCNQGGSRWPVALAVYPALRRWQVGPLLCSRANVVQSKFDQVAGARLGIVASHDFGATPRPICKAGGSKLPDCYTVPDSLRDRLTERLGPFPLFQFWGPATTIASTRWIADATKMVMAEKIRRWSGTRMAASRTIPVMVRLSSAIVLTCCDSRNLAATDVKSLLLDAVFKWLLPSVRQILEI